MGDEITAHVMDPVAEWRWSRGDTGRVVVAGLTVLIGGFAASRGVPSLERATFLKLNGLPDTLYALLWAPMQIGNVWVGTGVAVVAAALVGTARVYVGVHLPLDVVGGAAGGLLIGEAARGAELWAQRRAARRTSPPAGSPVRAT